MGGATEPVQAEPSKVETLVMFDKGYASLCSPTNTSRMVLTLT